VKVVVVSFRDLFLVSIENPPLSSLPGFEDMKAGAPFSEPSSLPPLSAERPFFRDVFDSYFEAFSSFIAGFFLFPFTLGIFLFPLLSGKVASLSSRSAPPKSPFSLFLFLLP